MDSFYYIRTSDARRHAHALLLPICLYKSDSCLIRHLLQFSSSVRCIFFLFQPPYGFVRKLDLSFSLPAAFCPSLLLQRLQTFFPVFTDQRTVQHFLFLPRPEPSAPARQAGDQTPPPGLPQSAGDTDNPLSSSGAALP